MSLNSKTSCGNCGCTQPKGRDTCVRCSARFTDQSTTYQTPDAQEPQQAVLADGGKDE